MAGENMRGAERTRTNQAYVSHIGRLSAYAFQRVSNFTATMSVCCESFLWKRLIQSVDGGEDAAPMIIQACATCA